MRMYGNLGDFEIKSFPNMILFLWLKISLVPKVLKRRKKADDSEMEIDW